MGIFGNSNFGGGNNVGAYYKALYNSNKALIWISGLAILGMLIAGVRFLDAFFISYLLLISGILFRQYFSNEKLIAYISLGMLSGFLVYLLFFQQGIIIPNALSGAVGSAAFAVLVATATYAPNSVLGLAFIGKVKIKWIAIVLVGLDILTINPSDPSYRIAHLGGVLFGFLAIYLSKGQSFSFKNGLSGFFRKKGPYYKKPKNAYYEPAARRETDEDYNARKLVEQEEIDRILDKIKQSGYETLSSDEKKKLFDKSRS